ncbi:hypothetical protein [Algoriphagus namhaensis]
MKLIQPYLLLPLILLVLVLGLTGGSIRMGAQWPDLPGMAAGHGLLMTGGFLGALISLERAVVMKQRFWYLVPLFAILTLPLLSVGEQTYAVGSLLLSALGLIAMMHLHYLKHPRLHTALLYIGAACWLVGNWMVGYQELQAAGVTWWMGFILFTIVGERLELSQFLPVPTWARQALLVLLMLYFIGILLPFHGSGKFLLGISAGLIALWLLRFDMARISVRHSGQFRYTGLGLLVGYLWLGLHGLILLFGSTHLFYYDLMIHSFFLGFVFSMIWAHAPIILPGVFQVKISPYHPILWWTWTAFQFTLLARVVCTLAEAGMLRKTFGISKAVLILIQFGLMAAIFLLKIKMEREETALGDRNHPKKSLDSPTLLPHA